MGYAMMTVVDLGADPADRARVFVHAYGADGKLLFSVWARNAESAKALLAESPHAELVYLRGPGVPDRVWRDASSRQWRTK